MEAHIILIKTKLEKTYKYKLTNIIELKMSNQEITFSTVVFSGLGRQSGTPWYTVPLMVLPLLLFRYRGFN